MFVGSFLLQVGSLLNSRFSGFLGFCGDSSFVGKLHIGALGYLPRGLYSLLSFRLGGAPFYSRNFCVPSSIGSVNGGPLRRTKTFCIRRPSTASTIAVLSIRRNSCILSLYTTPNKGDARVNTGLGKAKLL